MSSVDVVRVNVDRLVDWYLGERIKLMRGDMANENAAFQKAADWALGHLNENFKQRINMLIHDLSEVEQQRIQAACIDRTKQHLLQHPWGHGLRKPPLGDLTLKHYLKVMEDSLTAARSLESKLAYKSALKQVLPAPEATLRVLDGNDTEEKRQDAVRMIRVLWAQLRNARVFDFDAEIFATAYTEADRYTTEKIAGCVYTPSNGQNPFSTQEAADEYLRKIREAGSRVPFPEHLPFESIYIGFGFGIPLGHHQIIPRMIAGPARDRVIGAAILGILISSADGGRVTEMIQIVEAEDNYTLPVMTCEHGIWDSPEWSLHPWVINHLVSILGEHQKFTVTKAPGLGFKKDLQKLGKRVGIPDMIPRPYYLLRMTRNQVIETSERENRRLSAIRRELSYRHDRMHHERCYIRRGKLPLDEKEAKKLAKADYKIWTLENPDAAACVQLMKRGQPPKGTDEWLAILTRWIDDQVVGSEELPYVPAIRIPSLA